MARRYVAYLVLLASLSAGSLEAQTDRPRDFGRQWVRTHPFTLMALTLSDGNFDSPEYKGAGLGTVLAWEPSEKVPFAASRAKLPWHYQTGAQTGSLSMAQIVDRFSVHYQQAPGCQGVMVGDEPQRIQMEQLSQVIKSFHQKYPDLLTYSNAFPIGNTSEGYYGGPPPNSVYTWGQYLRDFVNILHPDVLMFDIYPFIGTGTSGQYFAGLESIRAVAMEAEIPYWTFVQAYEDSASKMRLPSESDLRMQVFSSLAYGFTGIAYFTYDIAFQRGLLEPDGTPNQLYHHAMAVNSEVAHLGDSLRFLKSTSVRFIPGRHESSDANGNSTPSGMTNWAAGAGGDSQITNISVNLADASNIGSEKNGLIGFFADDNQDRYFMLVNLYHGAALSAAESNLGFTITFDSSVNSLLYLNRLTGKEEKIALDNHRLTWKLPGGTGDLFKYDTGKFISAPSIDSKPFVKQEK